MKVENKNNLSFSLKGLYLFLYLCLILWMLQGYLFFKYEEEELFRAINSNHSPVLDSFFYWISFVGSFTVIGPVLLGLCLLKYKSWKYFSLFAFTQLLPLLINQILKLSFAHLRPSVVFGQESWFHYVEGLKLHSGLSFPSGHTAGAFSFFTLLSILLIERNKYWAISFFILAVLVGYSRIYLGQHFFVDVFAGSIVGTTLTLIVFILWKNFFNKRQQSIL